MLFRSYYFAAALLPPDCTFLISMATQALCWAVAAVTVISGVIYIKDNLDVIKG